MVKEGCHRIKYFKIYLLAMQFSPQENIEFLADFILEEK